MMFSWIRRSPIKKVPRFLRWQKTHLSNCTGPTTYENRRRLAVYRNKTVLGGHNKDHHRQLEMTKAFRFSVILFYGWSSVQFKAVTRRHSTVIQCNHFSVLSYTRAKTCPKRGDKSYSPKPQSLVQYHIAQWEK